MSEEIKAKIEDLHEKAAEVSEMTLAEIDKAKVYALSMKDAVEDEIEDTVEDAKGFFEEHKVAVYIIGAIVALGAIVLVIL